MDEKPAAAHDARRRAKIPTRILELKKRVFEQVDFALRKAGVSLRTLFKRIDTDGTLSIEQPELAAMFREMNVSVMTLTAGKSLARLTLITLARLTGLSSSMTSISASTRVSESSKKKRESCTKTSMMMLRRCKRSQTQRLHSELELEEQG